jgi:hypothetical protein
MNFVRSTLWLMLVVAAVCPPPAAAESCDNVIALRAGRDLPAGHLLRDEDFSVGYPVQGALKSKPVKPQRVASDGGRGQWRLPNAFRGKVLSRSIGRSDVLLEDHVLR